ncbi:vanz family protein [Brevundimonas sp.]|uniref:vanz family protein n=1 Tax=Brevundimonas sp. TaxID=1871086 RepID=UPI0035AFEB2D
MPVDRRLLLVRLGLGLFLLVLAALTLGPFQGLERRLGLSDAAAHAIAFYGLSLALFAAAPRSRRSDLALCAFGVGVLIEALQALVGRSLSLSDLAADAAGVLAAFAPAYIERTRTRLRRGTGADVGFRDRRGPRRTTAVSGAPRA